MNIRDRSSISGTHMANYCALVLFQEEENCNGGRKPEISPGIKLNHKLSGVLPSLDPDMIILSTIDVSQLQEYEIQQFVNGVRHGTLANREEL